MSETITFAHSAESKFEAVKRDEKFRESMDFLLEGIDEFETAFHEAITEASEKYDQRVAGVPGFTEGPNDREFGIIQNLSQTFRLSSNGMSRAKYLHDIVDELIATGVAGDVLGDARLVYALANSGNISQNVSKEDEVQRMLVTLYKHNSSPKAVAQKIQAALS